MRDYRALIIVVVLSAAEVAILYILIAMETPVTPFVHRLLERPLGVFALVIWALSILIVGMWGFTSWVEWLHRKRDHNELSSQG